MPEHTPLKNLNLKITPLEYDFLTLLSNKELYGSQIKSIIDTADNRNLSFSALYGTLRRLEKKECIKSSSIINPIDPNVSKRIYYRITHKGEKVLSDIEQRRLHLVNWKRDHHLDKGEPHA